MYNCIIIAGPTASGKTKISIELAKKLNGEIVNADSMQVYKELNIGTAKITENEKENIPHHLFDFVDKFNDFTVADYREVAYPLILDLIKQNKTPIIVGGTGFYINSLLYNFDYGNSSKNEIIRKKYEDLADKFGCEYVYNILKEVDSETAKKLHPNDLKRVIRAIEIYETTGNKKSAMQNTMQTFTTDLKPLIIGLTMDRSILYNRINQRVDIMIKDGLIDEVKKLVKSGLNLSHQSMNGIGYKEILSYLNNEISLEDAVELIKKHTRNYAKRQITWFKKLQTIKWIDLSNGINSEIINEISNEYLSSK